MTSSRSRDRSLLTEFLLGASSTTTACLFTHPLEVTKTVMQAQGQAGGHRSFDHSLQCFSAIWRSGGVRALQMGLLSGVLYQVSMNGVRLGTYQPIKELLGATMTEPESGLPSFYFLRTLLSGCISGALGATVGSPWFLIKVRLQLESTRVTAAKLLGDSTIVDSSHIPRQLVGVDHGYHGSVLRAMRAIYKEGGLLGFTHGIRSGIMRVTVGSSVQLSSFDNIKQSLKRRWPEQFGDQSGNTNQWRLRVVSSLVAALLVTAAMNPFDVVATRVYSNRKDSALSHGGRVFPALKSVVSEEGVSALFRGFFPHLFRLGPHTVLTFVIWEYYSELADRFHLDATLMAAMGTAVTEAG